MQPICIRSATSPHKVILRIIKQFEKDGVVHACRAGGKRLAWDVTAATPAVAALAVLLTADICEPSRVVAAPTAASAEFAVEFTCEAARC